MTTRDKNDHSNISLLDAVEALSTIADLELERDLGIAQRHDLIVQETPFTYRTVHWLHRQGSEETIQIVKNIFRVILNYLKEYYTREYHTMTQPQTIEGIKTIMLIVGEAAKKLDRFTTLFHEKKSVTELKEYKQLQEFYQTRIARKVDEGVLGKWLLALTKKAWAGGGRLKLTAKPDVQTKHVFIELDTVKKDSDYDLLILRKEDGTRFYNPRLIRNIKLLCDFGEYFPSTYSKLTFDPLEDVAIWQDRMFHAAAKEIFQAVHLKIQRFYREAFRYKEKEIIGDLNKILMALMLAANPQNLMRNNHEKSCTQYFADFQIFLRRTLQSVDYHKMITYPKPSNKLSQGILDLLHGLCLAFFENVNPLREVGSFVQGIIQTARENQSSEHEKVAKESHAIWNVLACDGAALIKLFKHHTTGPLIKMLDFLQKGGIQAFDPLMQQNIPSRLYSLGMAENRVVALQIPSPTYQEVITKASIVEEFKGFLRGCLKDNFVRKHLLINLQDRTSWREHARCVALEELQHVEEFDEALTVVTLSKDSEFYHQLSPYTQENHADVFMQHFRDHLQDESAGFYFPMALSNQLFPHFVDGVLEAIHRVFFSSRNVLSKEHRLDFIEIFYLFLQLKLIEISKPDSFSFTCKDGIDGGATAHTELNAFMKLISSEKIISEIERDSLNLILHTPALIQRQRLVLPERFNRMMSALKAIESIRSLHGEEAFALIIQNAFGDFFKSHILQALIGK